MSFNQEKQKQIVSLQGACFEQADSVAEDNQVANYTL
jgi:hypothetical protein